MKQITVGVDASPESAAAVHWAATEAALRHEALHLVHLWLLRGMTAQTIPREDSQLRAAQLLLQEAEARVRSEHPTVRVTSALVSADSPDALLTEAGGPAHSDLLVLGSQGLGAVPGYLLGSVGLHAVAHATHPIVLVRADGHADGPGDGRGAGRVEGRADGRPGGRAGATGRPGPVAVGVSVRPGHEPVLEFAFAAAARRGTPLLAVHAANRHPALSGRADLEHRSAADEAAERFHEALRPWRDKFSGVHVVEHLSHESPSRAVVDITPGADLLVVGRGRHNAFGPQIGPVAHAAIHHATCPVATIPHP